MLFLVVVVVQVVLNYNKNDVDCIKNNDIGTTTNIGTTTTTTTTIIQQLLLLLPPLCL